MGNFKLPSPALNNESKGCAILFESPVMAPSYLGLDRRRRSWDGSGYRMFRRGSCRRCEVIKRRRYCGSEVNTQESPVPGKVSTREKCVGKMPEKNSREIQCPGKSVPRKNAREKVPGKSAREKCPGKNAREKCPEKSMSGKVNTRESQKSVPGKVNFPGKSMPGKVDARPYFPGYCALRKY